MSRLSAQSPDAPFILVSTIVRRIEQLSPTYRRFTFTGPEVERIADNRYDQRVKLIFPTAVGGFDDLPLADDWYTAWRALSDERRNTMRTYTIREVRREDREFDIDIALHGRLGPASTWAIDASIGDELVMNVPNASRPDAAGGIDWHAPAEVGQVLLVGDETALPAIAGILEKLPADALGIAVVEVPHEDDVVILSTKPAGIELIVLARGEQPVGTLMIPEVDRIAARILAEGGAEALAGPKDGSDPSSELADIDVDRELLWEVPVDEHGGPVLASAPLYAWLAGEASAIKTLRRHLVSTCGVNRKSVAFMGYWRTGKSEDNL
ncbi:siderophore-interacting protein [Plantibacter sp. YIM 135249]|uniref:siderophore-interacting protein n=1 Tax=Plantibacter sp. YIM 135249 TaxID=3423918 RepID=UPI003D34EF8E